jgi:hypothetical protein
MTHQVGPCIGDLAKIIVEANYVTLRKCKEFRKDLKNKNYVEIAEKLNDYYKQEIETAKDRWTARINRRQQKEEQRQEEKLQELPSNQPIINMPRNQQYRSGIPENQPEDNIKIISRTIQFRPGKYVRKINRKRITKRSHKIESDTIYFRPGKLENQPLQTIEDLEEEEEIIENDDEIEEISSKSVEQKPVTKSKRKNYQLQQRELLKSVSMEEIIKRNSGLEQFIAQLYKAQAIKQVSASMKDLQSKCNEFRENLFQTFRQRVHTAEAYIKEKEKEDKEYIEKQRALKQKVSISFKQINQVAAREAKKITAYSQQAMRSFTEAQRQEILNHPDTKRMQREEKRQQIYINLVKSIDKQKKLIAQLEGYSRNSPEVKTEMLVLTELEKQLQFYNTNYPEDAEFYRTIIAESEGKVA